MRPSVAAIIGVIVDAFRVSAAFRAAARGDSENAMRKLLRLGDFTSATFEVRLLKGALHSHIANHQAAADELLAAARAVRADTRLSRAEMNYLVAYAFQYWAYSAHQVGLEPTEEMRTSSGWKVRLKPA